MNSMRKVTLPNFRIGSDIINQASYNFKTARNVYRNFESSTTVYPRFTHSTVHFRQSLKSCKKQSFLWGEKQESAFKNITYLASKNPSLFHYDFSKKPRLKCDASHNGLGACLEQEIEPGH